jgi:hypothetical protein
MRNALVKLEVWQVVDVPQIVQPFQGWDNCQDVSAGSALAKPRAPPAVIHIKRLRRFLMKYAG